MKQKDLKLGEEGRSLFSLILDVLEQTNQDRPI